ncbi:MAG: methanogenesis marker protein Mmp4/MtxX [Candidatus Methanomethylophilaceae archaeon]|nr:methanogenesis marker protein Mmp4/MtxX [Candidatus Methanomethylophilaceae archaeon]
MEEFDITVYDSPYEMSGDLSSGKIDAAVRGDMPSSVLLPILKSNLNMKSLERVAFMELPNGKIFILAPVGIDEGWSQEQKYDIAVRSAEIAGRIGMGSRIAIMSGGRCEDVGRCRVVDKSIGSARELSRKLTEAGFDAYHSQILIEEAVKEADIILAPEGITGNIIFRSLHFIGGLKSLGAPLINTDRVFVDTSRSKTDYRTALALAMKLTEV